MSAHGEPVLVHRLKNQLTIILGFADLLIRDNETNDRCRQDALEIRKAATTALELIVAETAAHPDRDPFS
jgi:light-regulated signal transduction histidine kinase (bacteriophytochrome)